MFIPVSHGEAAIAASRFENIADKLATQMQMSLTLLRQTPKSTVAIYVTNVQEQEQSQTNMIGY